MTPLMWACYRATSAPDPTRYKTIMTLELMSETESSTVNFLTNHGGWIAYTNCHKAFIAI